jgi:hypothetical protein
MVENLRICDLRTHIPQNFTDLLLRIEYKNLRICDLWTSENICAPNIASFTDFVLFETQKDIYSQENDEQITSISLIFYLQGSISYDS